ncbi:unnamed protein product [Rotaria magnacalcarata]|uniref:G domain-containing protein n=1 Tax=Rotaria magnacalcarata TaxID=392030 RepID=A0A815L0M1_9BILA|nr:unnamed protein product [Rotaria magnacalcarata]
MVYFRIRAHCLAQQCEWKKEYNDIIDLKKDIIDHFQIYTIDNESSIIVYYDEKEKCDRIFDNLDVLPTDNTTVFDIYVKRIWTCCAVCFGSFDIIPGCLPLECIEKSCHVQYCVNCVNIICDLSTNRKFTCIFCKKTNDRPQRNILLENIFLWKPYTNRYSAHSTECIETIFNGPNLSGVIHRIENRRTHIKVLQTTLKRRLSTIADQDSYSNETKSYLGTADHLIDKLESFITQLRTCERNIRSQAITFRALTNNYRTLLRDSICEKPSKQEAASFILLCAKLCVADYDTIEQSITCVNDILEDIGYRRRIIEGKQQQIAEFYLNISCHPFRFFYTVQHDNATKMLSSFEEFERKFICFRDIYYRIDSIMQEYRDELMKKPLNDTSNEYSSLPTTEQMATFQCSRLILVSELLRSETDRIEMEALFPRITETVKQWKQTQDHDPKIYDLFYALEQDLLLLNDPNYSLLNLIPFRVGFIGNISVGKSSLVNYLRTENSISTLTNRTLSPIGVGQSTVGSLQFDEQHQYSNTQPIVTIRYVDIEGYTACNTPVQAASYFEQIQKADCDLYIILFTGQQVSFERELENKIRERLNRPCWYVRSKIDEEFKEQFKEQVTRRKIDYHDIEFDEHEENELAEQIIEMIREKTIEICQTSRDNVFLVNSLYSNSKTHPFDIHLLSERLIYTAQQPYVKERIKRTAVMVCTRIIGIYFRRRCIISFINHALRAGIGAMVLPWGDQLALVHTRFGIRLALGVQDRSYLYNRVLNKVDAFTSLLVKYQLNINPDDLQSDEFNYLKIDNSSILVNTHDPQNEYSKTMSLGSESKTDSSIVKKISSAIPAGVVASGLVVKRIAAATLAVGSFGYGISVGFFGLGFAASIPIGLWAMKTSDQEMRNYLDKLCADLLIISEHFVVAIINQQEAAAENESFRA